MKKIVLIRHAKSSWKNEDLKDLERPLKKRGANDARLMGNVLKDKHVKPDLIITSPALRAMQTAKIIAREIGFDENQIITEPELYMASHLKLLKEINKIIEQHNTVFLISHNPGLTDLANSLGGESLDNVPTCGAVGFQFEYNTWAEVKEGNGKKIFFEIPKKHRKKSEKAEHVL